MNTSLINQRLADIQAVIPFDILLSRQADDKLNIAKYYKANRLAYRLINSKQGFVHMGISDDDTFHENDFLEHARIIASYIEQSKGSDVLELAAGKAATTKYLADEYAHINFTGLDLPNGQLDIASSQSQNLTLLEGDYHDLSQFSSESFDVVYIIEALCHARNKATVIQEVARILKPNGTFIIFDGYVSKPRAAMTETEALVSDLTYTSMMVTKDGHLYADVQRDLKASGLAITVEEDLSRNVLPSMKRLESKAVKYFTHPRLAKMLNKILPIEVTGNAVAAYLMPLSVDSGLHQYWMTVAIKKR